MILCVGKFFSASTATLGANIGLHGNVFIIDGMGLPKEFRDRYPKFSIRLGNDGITPSGYATTDFRSIKGEVQAAPQVPAETLDSPQSKIALK